jgi:hypothetical protein
MKKEFITIFLVLFTINVNATDYYVRTDGSNSNNGLSNTSGGAWLTVAYACTHVSAGTHLIHVGTGTFHEDYECVFAAGVSITGIDSASTHIISHFATSQSNWQPRHGAFTFSSSSVTNGNQSVSNLTLDGDNQVGNIAGTTAYIGIMIYQRSNVIIHDCGIRDFWSEGIVFLGTAFNFGAPIADINDPPIYATGNQIYNCTVDNCTDQADSNYPGSLAMVVIGSQSTMEIHDNIFIEKSRAVGHNGDIITSGWWEQGIKIYNNVFTKINDDGASYNFHIEMWNTTGGFEVYENQFYGGDCAINIAGLFNLKGTYNYSWYIHDNYFETTNLVNSENSNRVCIIMEDENFEHVIVTRNHFYKYPRVVAITNGSVPNSIIKNIEFTYNIMEQCGWDNPEDNYWTRLLEIGNDYSENTIDNVLIANNVFQTNARGQTEAIRIVVKGKTNNIEIKNNIVVNSFNGAWLTVRNGGIFKGLYVTNNIQYNNANSNDPIWGGVNHTYINYIKSDPLFVSNTNFHLRASSPGINAGVNVGLAIDFNGIAVSSPPEIGAYEYVSSHTGPTITKTSKSLATTSSCGYNKTP